MEKKGIKILAFGRITEIVGGNEFYVSSDFSMSNDLKDWLLERFPDLGRVQFLMSVNRKIINENTMINPSCELALLPPFSGG